MGVEGPTGIDETPSLKKVHYKTMFNTMHDGISQEVSASDLSLSPMTFLSSAFYVSLRRLLRDLES